mgnify:CR=1 FL=1
MYPSLDDKLFGVFVKNFKEEIEAQDAVISETSLIKGKSKSKIKKLFRYIKHYIKILNIYLNGHYDIIYIHYVSHHIPILLLMIIFKKSPIIINVHGSDITFIKKNFFLKYAVDLIFKKVDRVVSPSISLKKSLLMSFKNVIDSRVYVYPSGGINSSAFYPIQVEKNNTLHLGFVSRIIANKGWKVFLDALKILKENHIDFKATIAGKGKDESSLIRLIEKYDLKNTEFVGFVDQQKLFRLYNKFDLYIFPTLNDSLGLTGLEAMACGTPVIASDIDGPSTYVKNGQNGYLFNVNDFDGLANKIMFYRTLSQSQKINFKENALKTASYYDKSLVTKKLLIEMKSLINT